MPNQEDSQAIDSLFDRIEDVSRNSQPRDADAEVLIQQRLRQYPPAPYYMAQTILIQEEALRQAQEKIKQLEGQSRQRGGFLGGLFGDDEPRNQPARSKGPWGYADQAEDGRRDGRRNIRGGGGGFLAGAAQTAIGVTGGVLLGSAIAGMLTGDAQAEEMQPVDEAPEDTGGDVGGGEDFGGGGDFDMGGDF